MDAITSGVVNFGTGKDFSFKPAEGVPQGKITATEARFGSDNDVIFTQAAGKGEVSVPKAEVLAKLTERNTTGSDLNDAAMLEALQSDIGDFSSVNL
ncbi:hypothetical protein HOG98_03175 [bacterium]|jgi:hypothetical protein|nr:hypothetical protein [bacterium]